jgi:predicted heme/steroid binding protein
MSRRPASPNYCCRRFALLLVAVPLVGTLTALAMHGGSPAAVWASANFAMMRLFRDLSRAKARRRRFGQRNALMPLLMGSEEPLPLGDASAGLGLTVDELAEYDGRLLPDSSERAPLFLAIRGRIYDVSAGVAFYGPGRSYHKLVGKDATRAFCTGCLEPDCLISSTMGLAPSQLKEADRWIELYEHHDKYKLVGAVREPNMAELLDEAEDTEGASAKLERQAEEIAEAQKAIELEQVARAQEAEGLKAYRPFRKR